jgi:ATP-binding cassette, subfamily A (ABC1), member 5
VGVPKPFYFIVQPSYWFPKKSHELEATATTSAISSAAEENGIGSVKPIPNEPANESLLGPPAVVVNKLRKTFGQQVSVNDLSFKMYENQIFALLGHNGAGKVRKLFVMF